MRQATCLFTGSLPGYGNQHFLQLGENFFFFFFSQIQNMSPIDLPLHEISSLLQLFAQYGLFPSLLIRSYSLISFWRTLFTFISNLYFPVLSEEYTCLTQNKFTDVTIHSLGVYLNLIRWEKAALLILVF